MEQKETLELVLDKLNKIGKDVESIKYEVDELVYHPEETLKPEFIERIEKASKEGKYNKYKSVQDLRKKIEQDV